MRSSGRSMGNDLTKTEAQRLDARTANVPSPDNFCQNFVFTLPSQQYSSSSYPTLLCMRIRSSPTNPLGLCTKQLSRC